MPSQLDPALEERHADVLGRLRATRVEPSAELRQRVRTLSQVEPTPRRPPLLGRRVLIPALVGAVLVGAVVAGLVLRGSNQQQAVEQGASGAGVALGKRDSAHPAALSPGLGRLQDYRAQLRVRIDGAGKLSQATQQAMTIAQSVGGYVVSASYGGGSSDSLLVLRVPIARAQETIGRLTALGKLDSQRFSLQDLQSTVDQLDAQADRLQQQIATLGQQLRSRNLTPGERVALRNRLEQAQRELDDVLAQRDSTAAQGRSAEITMTLTAGKPQESGRSVLGRAVDALAHVWAWVLAVLIVGTPFALLLAAALFAGRRLRRRANERLLGA